MLTAEPITDLSDLQLLESEWDDLAAASTLPLMAPACVIAWLAHLAPASVEPRVIAVRDGGTLVGLAPFYLDLARPGGRLDLRLPGIELAARLAPLARAGREQEVAGAISRAIAALRPRPDLIALEGLPLESHWASSIRAGWPGRLSPIGWRYQVRDPPAVTLDAGSFEDWMKAKSSKFRSQMSRSRRQFEGAGGTVRACTPQTLASDVRTLLRLHEARWQGRGQSNLAAYGEALAGALQEMGEKLLSRPGRFMLWTLEIDGEPICCDLSLGAGGRVLGVVNGWDEQHSRLKPAMLSILTTIEEAFARGDTLVDLGTGAQAYKLRFADTQAPICWTVLLPAGAGLPRAYLSVASMVGRGALRTAVRRRLSAEQADRYRRLARRLHPQPGA